MIFCNGTERVKKLKFLLFVIPEEAGLLVPLPYSYPEIPVWHSEIFGGESSPPGTRRVIL